MRQTRSILTLAWVLLAAMPVDAQPRLRGPSRQVAGVVVREHVRRDGTRVRHFYKPASASKTGAGLVRIQGREGLFRFAGGSLVGAGGHTRMKVKVSGAGLEVTRAEAGGQRRMLRGKSALAALRTLRSASFTADPPPEPGAVVPYKALPRKLKEKLQPTDSWVGRERLPQKAAVVRKDTASVTYIESVARSTINRGYKRVGLRWTEALRGNGKQADKVGFFYTWPSSGFDARVDARGRVNVRMNIRLEDGTGYGEGCVRSLAKHLKQQIEQAWDKQVALVDKNNPSGKLPVRFSINFHTGKKKKGEHAVVTIRGADYGDNHANWSMAATRGVVPHEIGHHMGNPDEYKDRGWAPLRRHPDGASIMKGCTSKDNANPLPRHFKAVATWLSAETGRQFTVQPLR